MYGASEQPLSTGTMPGSSAGRLRGGLRRDSTGFESELRRWFQARLCLLALFSFGIRRWPR